jgi:hypothetical protein
LFLQERSHTPSSGKNDFSPAGVKKRKKFSKKKKHTTHHYQRKAVATPQLVVFVFRPVGNLKKGIAERL